MCGFAVGFIGSPPLTRGKVLPHEQGALPFGITPAYAGKSNVWLYVVSSGTGSPPLTRGKAQGKRYVWIVDGITPAYAGKVRRDPDHLSALRITPAYAGKRLIMSSASALVKDHPRLRGEKLPQNLRDPCFLGSPPLTRGKDKSIQRCVTKARITPAYAGKSMAHSLSPL